MALGLALALFLADSGVAAGASCEVVREDSCVAAGASCEVVREDSCVAAGASCEAMLGAREDKPTQDGFFIVRKANQPDGKKFTAHDIVYGRESYPARVRNYYKRVPDKQQSSSQASSHRSGSRQSNAQTSSRHSEPQVLKPYLFSRDASIYAVGEQGDTTLVAEGGKGIVYGESVSRNEFGIEGGIFPAHSAARAAFYRKDESLVQEFPLLDIRKCALKSIRYPMNSGVSEYIQVGVYNFTTSRTIYLDTDNVFGRDQYLTNVCWSPDDTEIFIQILDRSQQNVKLNRYSAIDGSFLGTVLTEHSDTWVEPREVLHWVKECSKGSTSADRSSKTGTSAGCIPSAGTSAGGGFNAGILTEHSQHVGAQSGCITSAGTNAGSTGWKAIYTTDARDGWWNLYLLDTGSGSVSRLTAIEKDVKYVGNDGTWVYFTAPDEHPVNNYLWKVSLKTRRISLLTPEKGWHSIEMAPDCSSFVDVYEALDRAPQSLLRSSRDGRTLQILKEAEDSTLDWAYPEIELGSIPCADGIHTNYYRMVKPAGFDPSLKYPLVLYVYGGPHSQLVRNTFLGGLRRWELLMAQKGYVVFVMDGRGTEGHGAAYEHSIWRQCGQNEMKDQILALDRLKGLPWIDSSRIGVYGWSYGGFMSLSLATTYNDCFKVCVAGGPVIDWKWYEVMYGERYMSRLEDNPEGFAKTSLLGKAKDLKARTLVIEGGVDPVVVPQHALSFLQECIDAGVRVEYFTYPQSEHNMYGKDRVHLVDKITAFFEENL